MDEAPQVNETRTYRHTVHFKDGKKEVFEVDGSPIAPVGPYNQEVETFGFYGYRTIGVSNFETNKRVWNSASIAEIVRELVS